MIGPIGPLRPMQETVNLLQVKRAALYAIDAHSANALQRTGVENYAFHLIQAMKNHPLQEGERVVLYSYEPLREPLATLPEGWSSKVLKWFPRVGWMSFRVVSELRRDRPNVFFVPAQAIPKSKVPIVTTIHDVGFRVVPELYDPVVAKRLVSKTQTAIARARHLLAVSEATKRDLVEQYHVATERITVTPLAADSTTYQPIDAVVVKDVQQKYRIGQRFFLTVGRLEKKKNISMLIRAFDLFKAHRGSGDPYELILVGTPGYGYSEIKSYIDASPYKNQIRELGYAADEEVAALMTAATAYVFPSSFEGFGIPNLEAMSCGTPLITSDLPAHREVVGDAGIFVAANDPEAWEREMTSIIDNATQRAQLIERGKNRAQQFSWDKTATQTWDVLRGLL